MNRSTISSIVHVALEQELKKEGSLLYSTCKDAQYLPDLLWDPLEPHRVVKLATHRPDLLNHQEQIIWEVIKANPNYWEGTGIKATKPDYWTIRKDWEWVKAKAERWATGDFSEED